MSTNSLIWHYFTVWRELCGAKTPRTLRDTAGAFADPERRDRRVQRYQVTERLGGRDVHRFGIGAVGADDRDDEFAVWPFPRQGDEAGTRGRRSASDHRRPNEVDVQTGQE